MKKKKKISFLNALFGGIYSTVRPTDKKVTMTFLSSWGLTGSLERSSFSALYFTQKRRGRGPMTNAAAFFPKCAPSFDFGVLWPNHSTFLQNFWNFKISLLLSKSRLLHTGRESINWLKKDMSKYYMYFFRHVYFKRVFFFRFFSWKSDCLLVL